MDPIRLVEYEETARCWLNQHRRELAPATTRRRLAALRQFASWAGLVGCLSDYKAPYSPKGMAHPLPDGKDDLIRMIEAAKKRHHKALIGLMGFCGCRVSEAIDVRVKDFDVTTKMLRIRGKGDKERFVPISTKAWESILPAYVIAALKGEDEPLVSISNTSARRITTEIAARCNVSRHVASHDLRMTFGTETNNVSDIRTAQELLGHTHVTTTEIYTHVSLTQKREAVEF